MSRDELFPQGDGQGFLQSGEQGLVGSIDFGGFEGAVGGAVGEVVGKGFAICRELLASGVAELVEQVDARQQGDDVWHQKPTTAKGGEKDCPGGGRE